MIHKNKTKPANTNLCKSLFTYLINSTFWLNIKKKQKNRQYPTETITDKDYVDNLAILANTSAQVETILHSLEQAAGCIGLQVEANKTEYMGFEQEGAISTANGKPLKLVDKFTYLGSSISSNESDVNICLANV